ncbi:MAG TPA: hypothetical protein VEC93_09055 [Anaerolineae bacterium]|nr:hypothetical protein [Anaerolineae bacterium]
MTATTQRRRQTEFVSSSRRQRNARRSQNSGSMIMSSLKAGLVGGFGILLLMLISLVPFEFLACLVIPGFLVVWLTTGLLAGVFAGDSIQNSQQGGKVGWMAGFWAGVLGGIVAMAMAAFGIFMVNFGQSVVNQLAPDQLAWLVNYGLTPEVIALGGRVVGALIVYGVIGSLVSGLFSSIGGMIYPKLSS